MKRILSMMMLILLLTVFLMEGCGSNKESKENTEKNVALEIETTKEAELVTAGSKQTPEMAETQPSTFDSEESLTETSTEIIGLFREEAFQMAVSQPWISTKAEEKGLSAELLEANTSPVFCISSKEDSELFCVLFGSSSLSHQKSLEEALAEYDENFFKDRFLYAVMVCGGSTNYKQEFFSVTSVLRGRSLHFRWKLSIPQGTGLDSAAAAYWLLISREKSAAADVLAYDASSAAGVMPADWTEAVNPDWRK